MLIFIDSIYRRDRAANFKRFSYKFYLVLDFFFLLEIGFVKRNTFSFCTRCLVTLPTRLLRFKIPPVKADCLSRKLFLLYFYTDSAAVVQWVMCWLIRCKAQIGIPGQASSQQISVKNFDVKETCHEKVS